MNQHQDLYDSNDFPLQGTYERNRVKCKFPVTIVCLDERCYEFVYDKETTIQDLLQSVCHSLNIENWQHFGLCLPIGKGHKFFPYTNFVKSSVHVDESNATYIHTDKKKKLYVSPILYLRLRLLEPINCLSNATMRKFYFQQLLGNMDRYQLMADECTFFRLGAFILQKEFGDYRNQLVANQKYCASIKSLPRMIVNQLRRPSECVIKCIRQMHDFVKGLSMDQAEFQFIKACSLPPYDINFHLVPLSSHDRATTPQIWPKLRPISLNLITLNHEPCNQVSRAKSLPRRLSMKFKSKLDSMTQVDLDIDAPSKSKNLPNLDNAKLDESKSRLKKYWLAIKPEGLQVYEQDEQGYLLSTASGLKWDQIERIRAPMQVFMKDSDQPVVFNLSVLEYNSPSAKSLMWLIKDMRYQFFAAEMNASQSLQTFETSDCQPFKERYVSDQPSSSSQITSPIFRSAAKVFHANDSYRDQEIL
ncbi:FERM and PDZ domain containing 2 [Cichlidogyrus casuarinus]|uniref:FERM and PDZ domain containing 2 n=1 Tax=Cichlidogyrus casuarinus TaxID=1844966 RepID=A0ABD2QDK1_9PLAT